MEPDRIIVVIAIDNVFFKFPCIPEINLTPFSCFCCRIEEKGCKYAPQRDSSGFAIATSAPGGEKRISEGGKNIYTLKETEVSSLRYINRDAGARKDEWGMRARARQSRLRGDLGIKGITSKCLLTHEHVREKKG